MCYYFDELIKIEDFDLDNVLIDEKSSNNILACNSSYKTLIGAKPLHSRFDKNDGFIRACDRTRYLVIFGAGKYDFIYNRIIYIIGVKSGITYVISHNYVNTKVDSHDSLPLEKKIGFT